MVITPVVVVVYLFPVLVIPPTSPIPLLTVNPVPATMPTVTIVKPAAHHALVQEKYALLATLVPVPAVLVIQPLHSMVPATSLVSIPIQSVGYRSTLRC